MTAETSREGTWLESIGLFQQTRAGDHQAAMRLLETSADPATVVHGLFRMLVVFLRGEDADKLERFVDASLRAGAPPLTSPVPGQTLAHAEGLAERLRGEVHLTAAMRELLAAQLPILATATRDGMPDVGPKRSMRVWDERTLIYNENTAGQHLANIRAGSAAVVAVIDRDALDGYRFVGTPQVHEGGDVFAAAVDFAAECGMKPPAAAVLIHLHEVHALAPGATAGTRIA
ncbi:pyridoxamine 5'-phosphate oxidase family protein [Microbacterium sp.]|uniref:pyridoxamine 5'-phosphate oxidase family protein n=1 Tax=Microbacterium sp. TaxID=51671 RepID=UPI003F992DCE